MARSRRSNRIIIGSIIGVVVVIIVAVAAGVTASKHKSNKNSATSSSNPGSAPGSPGSTGNSSDPSVFPKNTAFKKSFWGISYTPLGSQLPNCTNTLENVIGDIQVLSQLTPRIHLYGADCNQSALVLEAIKQTKVNMTVYLGNYPDVDDNGTAYLRQRDTIDAAIQTYGTDNILGITVGNEFILDYLTANGGGDDPNSAVGNAGAAILNPDIEDTRSNIASMNLNKKIPIGTSDAGDYLNNETMQIVDYALANVHPWFANVSAQDAAGWTAEFFADTDVALGASFPNNPQMIIGETGWPTQSSDVGNESNGPSTASEANLQIFLDTFVCQANANGTEYFYFEFMDEPWKDVEFGGVEGWWGLLHSNRTMKNIVIPDCPV